MHSFKRNYKQTQNFIKMKKVIIILAACLIGFGATAQTQKIGHVNSLELLSIMPEMKKAQDAVKAYAETFETQLTKMQGEYKQKIEAYQAGMATMSDAIKEVNAKEIQDLESRIVNLNKTGEKKVQEKEQTLTAPILKKADEAIKAVAKEKGFAYIIDSSSGALLHAVDSDNILPLVKAKLGIK